MAKMQATGEATTGRQAVYLGSLSQGALPRSKRMSYRQARRIRSDPTVALARAAAIAPIVAAQWSVEAEPGTPEERVAFIRRTLLPIRQPLMQVACEGLCDYGWAPWEKVFEMRDDSRIVLKKLKPLLVDMTTIVVEEDTGAFAGLRQKDSIGNTVDLELNYAFLANARVEGTDWYGVPLLENVEYAHTRWETADERASQYDAKIAGANWVVHYPTGTSILGTSGVQVDNATIAAQMLEQLKKSGGIAMPSDLIDASTGERVEQWRIELVGDTGTRQGSFIERLRYLDTLKVRALLVPERALTEGQYGTKAEAETHANIAIVTRQLEHEHITRLVNWHIVDQLLALNFGEEARGSVRVVAPPLSDASIAYVRDIYKALLADPSTLVSQADELDFPAMRQTLGLPTRPDVLRDRDLSPIPLDPSIAQNTPDAVAASLVETFYRAKPYNSRRA